MPPAIAPIQRAAPFITTDALGFYTHSAHGRVFMELPHPSESDLSWSQVQRDIRAKLASRIRRAIGNPLAPVHVVHCETGDGRRLLYASCRPQPTSVPVPPASCAPHQSPPTNHHPPITGALIAAAPALLQACEEAYAILSDAHTHESLRVAHHVLYEAIQEARAPSSAGPGSGGAA